MSNVGDSVLNLMITKEHYFAYPDLSSDNLTNLRSVNVDIEKLARVAIKYNLHNHLQESRSSTLEYPLHSLGRINPPKVLADIVEVLIGAIYIDCNCSIDTTWQAVKDMLQSLITPETLEIQSVIKFIELCQKNNLRIELVDNWDKTREIEYFVDGKFNGKGKSSLGEKKEAAKNKAANNACHQVIKNLREKTSVDEMQS
ncbi:hypothetical protein R3W88_019968 [Solanum pinnatisectum]|uniref:RNase III domain-containing protein n=1 Tax=Solanum pinnatisectum TaxID=50273 RepID=A0AAV9KL70_9SOLN|nr:hypothetical protein R3W88_019968 [Solanum pinnatisectum]